MKIQLKRSSVLDEGVAKKPLPDQLEYGELAVNYAAADPAIFIKNSTNDVVQIAGANSLSAVPTLDQVTEEGNWSSNSMLVGGSLAEPNLSLGATGAVTAKDTVTVNAATNTFNSIIVNETVSGVATTRLKVIGNGGIALGGTIDTTVEQSQANIFLNADTGNIRSISFNTTGTISSDGKITGLGGADLSGTINISNSLNVTEGTSLTGTVTMGGNATIAGNLDVTGNINGTEYNLPNLDDLPAV